MPKILINEIDNTSGGVGNSYSNFTVVVPGLVATGKGIGIFDQNNICEFSTQKDFEEKIGIVAPSTVSYDNAGTPPTISTAFTILTPEQVSGTTPVAWPLNANDTSYEKRSFNSADSLNAALSTETGAGEFGAAVASALANGTLYKAVAKTAADDTEMVGRLENTDYKYVALGGADTGTVVSIEDNTATAATGDYVLVVTQTLSDTYEAGTIYCILSDLGTTATTTNGIAHYGNQIAWRLLGLGYKVLYKRIPSNADTVFDKTIIEDPDFWEPLCDRATYDFRYLMTGLLEDTVVANQRIIEVAGRRDPEQPQYTGDETIAETSGRGDCIALVDIDRTSYLSSGGTMAYANAILNIRNEVKNYGLNGTGKYVGIFAPAVTYELSWEPAGATKYDNNTLPASYHYLACAAKAFSKFNEWYAVGGFTRGVADARHTIASVAFEFGEKGVRDLSPRTATNGTDRAVNLVINIKNAYYIWGNRTAALLTDDDLKASHFLNIRQLCTSLKKQVYMTARKNTFEPNSELLWIKFCNGISPLLDLMKADQGIRSYKLIKVKSKKKAELAAKIKISPIEAVEDFYINVILVDSIDGADVETSELE